MRRIEIRLDRTDLTVSSILPGLMLSIVSFFISLCCSNILTEKLGMQENFNVWFDADSPQVYSLMCSRWSPEHYRASHHPYFSLFTTPLIWLIHELFAIEHVIIIRTMLALNSLAITLVIYLLFIFLTSHVLAASLWTLLFQISVGHLFWCGVPETFPFGALSILMPFLAVALLAKSKYEYPSLLLTTSFSFAITVTNVMSGLACAIMSLPLRRVWEMSKTILCLSVIGLSLQSIVIPPTRNGIWFIPDINNEMRWVAKPEVHNYCLRVFLVTASGIVAPESQVRDEPLPHMIRCGLTSQLGRYKRAGLVGCLFWFTLLFAGLFYIFYVSKSDDTTKRLFYSLFAVAGGQLFLHIFYGREIILYSAHFGPVFLLLSAFSCRVLRRPFAIFLASVLFVLLCVNNLQVFFDSMEYLRTGNAC